MGLLLPIFFEDSVIVVGCQVAQYLGNPLSLQRVANDGKRLARHVATFEETISIFLLERGDHLDLNSESELKLSSEMPFCVFFCPSGRRLVLILKARTDADQTILRDQLIHRVHRI